METNDNKNILDKDVAKTTYWSKLREIVSTDWENLDLVRFWGGDIRGAIRDDDMLTLATLSALGEESGHENEWTEFATGNVIQLLAASVYEEKWNYRKECKAALIECYEERIINDIEAEMTFILADQATLPIHQAA